MKIYAYVDETGQDTRGQIFLVAVVTVGKTRDKLRERLKEIERVTGKGKKRWSKSARSRRKDYISRIIESQLFVNCAYFAHYSSHHKVRSYVDLTILTAAKAILAAVEERPYEVTVYVDGLGSKTERKQFTGGLRKLHIKTRQVRGVRDESDEFIRLADAMAGFARDGIGEEGKNADEVMAPLFKKAVRNGTIKEI